MKGTAPPGSTDSKETLVQEDTAPESELDKPDFNAEQYVLDILSREGLEGILRVEAGLINGSIHFEFCLET